MPADRSSNRAQGSMLMVLHPDLAQQDPPHHGPVAIRTSMTLAHYRPGQGDRNGRQTLRNYVFALVNASSHVPRTSAVCTPELARSQAGSALRFASAWVRPEK